MPHITRHAPLILQVSNGIHASRQVVHDMRSALKSAQSYAEAGYHVCLMAATGQVVLTLARFGQPVS